jgi:hypothetical protein
MLIAGAILLVIAVGIVLLARSQRSKADAARATETLTCGDLTQLASGVGTEIGAGSFSRRCEVVGQAERGDGAALTAPHSGIEVVWHHSTITHRYWELEERRDSEGRTSRERVEREETVSDITSSAPFVVADGSGRVAVSPEGAEVDSPERIVDRFEPQTEAPRESFLGGLLRGGDDSGTLGFHYREWILRPGARLYVHGAVSDATGRLAFAKDGRYVVSTRSEEELVGSAESTARWATIAAAVAALAGLALVLAGALG